MLFAVFYLLLRRLVALAGGSAEARRNDIEVLVLRHQLAVLKRRVGRPRLRRRDRLFMAALSRVLPRQRWSSFLVSPQTLLLWRPPRESLLREIRHTHAGPSTLIVAGPLPSRNAIERDSSPLGLPSRCISPLGRWMKSSGPAMIDRVPPGPYSIRFSPLTTYA
jgi:hypothetical protein